MSSSGGNGKDDADAVVPAPEAGEPAAGETREGSPEAGLEPTLAEEDVALLRRERDELRDQVLRRRAEFENYRKRVERDVRAAAVDAAADALKQLVGSIDNLERALSAEGDAEAMRRGVELTLRDMRSAFEAQGVTVLDPAGQPFDPAFHQALVHEPVPGVPAGTVAEVFRKGYAYKERLLRPALVKVSSGDAAAAGGVEDVH